MTQAKAVLDSGAAGVHVPMVNTKADAELTVQMAKYPPLGSRGVGLARAQGYGEHFDAYVQNAIADSLLLVQNELRDAVITTEAILSVAGIDGIFIGSYGLSLSPGIPGNLTHPDLLEAKHKVLRATLAQGLIAGAHFVQPRTAASDCQKAISDGYRFIALGTDILLLGDSARALHHKVHGINK